MEEWSYIDECIEESIQKIFKQHPVHTLNDYERRKIIFEYLTKTIDYDHGKLNALIEAEITKTPVRRNPTEELLSVIDFNYGICNGISQYYKLLLERIGIKSHCVIVDDTTPVNHQMLLVYNQDTDTYSFDDVTSVIVGRGTQEEFFDYDEEQAKKMGQGTKTIYEDRSFVILPEEYINFVVKRVQGPTKTIEYLPENIKSLKPRGSVK